MLNLEEYNSVFSCNLDEDAFKTIMGNPCRIQDVDELIAVDSVTHEKFIFKKVEERSRFLRCPHCGGRLSEDRGGYRHCFSCHFEKNIEESQLY